MNKTVKIIIAIAVIVVAVVAVLVGVFSNNSSKPASNLNINNAEDLTSLVDQIYAGVTIEMPMLMTQELDTTDSDIVKTFTGLDSAENIEYLVASEPMMSSQAYSLVLVKAKAGTDVNAMAKAMNERINERKWLCVTAEKIYTAASGNVICLVMTNAQTAQTVFESFKSIAGSVGEVYERASEEIQLPEDMLQDDMMIEDMLQKDMMIEDFNQ